MAEHLEQAGKPFPGTAEEVEAVSGWYQERLRSGELASPTSEPGLARAMLTKLAGWMEASQ